MPDRRDHAVVVVVVKVVTRAICQTDLVQHRDVDVIRAVRRERGEIVSHVSDAVTKRCPVVSLAIPGLRDRKQVGIAIVIEGQNASQRVGNCRDVATRVVGDGEIVAVTIF